jgi:hypothetical protein
MLPSRDVDRAELVIKMAAEETRHDNYRRLDYSDLDGE